jgi:two-component system, NtrC family, response regulator HydG
VRKSPRVLIIDDEPEMLQWLTDVLSSEPIELRTAGRGAAALQLFESWSPDVVLTDLSLPDLDGVELLKRFKSSGRSVEVILLTGHASVPKAVEAMHAGAFGFVEKPVEPAALAVMVRNALDHCALRTENRRLRRQADESASVVGIIGRNRQLRDVLDTIRSVAPSQANCLIVGENGTGKELIANAIHAMSARAKGPFIKINCAAIPVELIESELFGHKKGSFTGAIGDQRGLFEQANGGSLLLDEIGEMPPYLQTKLLRVLQERAFRAIGSDRLVQLDIRLICSTNVDVDKAVKSGRLREDLLFRINTITLRVPPLRDRRDDLPVLCEHFLDKFRRRHGREVTRLSAEAMRRLMQYTWPGNVRELENAIERGVLLAKGPEIDVEALPEAVLSGATTIGSAALDPVFPPTLTLEEIERLALIQTLRHTRGNKQEAAQILGLYRPTLYSKIRRHGIDVRA